MTVLAYVLVLLPALLLFYSYWGYPALLWIISRARRTGVEPLGPSGATEGPTVSVVVPAYNEERQIAGAIEALLAQDYPAARRQILIVSDASTDSTDAIVRSYADRGV